MVNGAMRWWYSWDPMSTKEDTVVQTGDVGDRRFDPPEAALTMYPLTQVNGAGVDLMVRREVFKEVGGFEERFRGMLEDQSFIIKVFLRYPTYISSSVWILYRQHDKSTCAQTSRAAYLRVRCMFFDWLEDEVSSLGDIRVVHEYRRVHRKLRFQKLFLMPALEVLARVPRKVKDPVKKILRRSP